MAESVGRTIIVITIIAMAAMFASPLYALIWFRIRVRRFPKGRALRIVLGYYLIILVAGVVFRLLANWPLDKLAYTIPCVGFPTSFAGPFIAAWVVELARQAKRYRAGHCQACGYDLTGNVSGVCPECGAVANTDDADGADEDIVE